MLIGERMRDVAGASRNEGFFGADQNLFLFFRHLPQLLLLVVPPLVSFNVEGSVIIRFCTMMHARALQGGEKNAKN